MILKFLNPLYWKWRLRVRSIEQQFDVKFGFNAYSQNCYFEGRNFVNQNTNLYDSYIGIGTYIAGNSRFNKAQIGKFCSIGQYVRNDFAMHPTSKFVSTHPAFFSMNKQAGFTFTKENIFEEEKYVSSERKHKIIIENDVWIGNNVLIMDGVSIGNGAIIAAGAVVTKDVSTYSIVGGVPAKVIKKRFSDEEIEFLEKFKWWEKEFEWIKEHSKEFNSIKEFMKLYANKKL